MDSTNESNKVTHFIAKEEDYDLYVVQPGDTVGKVAYKFQMR